MAGRKRDWSSKGPTLRLLREEEADSERRNNEAKAALKELPTTTPDQPHKAVELEELKSKLGELFETLGCREKGILKMRFGLLDGYTYTYEECGHKFKVTRERVRQIEARALRKLQHPIRSRKLECFVEPSPFEEP